MEKKDSGILAIASREIVAAEACYHRTCYEGYTRAEASPTGASVGCGESVEDECANLKSEAYQMFVFYRSNHICTSSICSAKPSHLQLITWYSYSFDMVIIYQTKQEESM